MSFKESKLDISNNIIKGDKFVGEVMGYWELPLMIRTAEIVKHNDGDYLEIGFGLGLFATSCWDVAMNSYTIVEIHPEIIKNLKVWAKDKSNVIIIEGDWFDNLVTIGDRKYDGIYFDTHLDINRPKFRELVVDLTLKKGGIFSYFNCGDTDCFNYGDDLIIEEMLLKTDISSDYMGREQTMFVNYYKHH